MSTHPSKPRPKPYPFGSSLKARGFSAGSGFRFGFNTQEKDKEVYNNNETYTATFWEYDGRLGRRWNVDPVVQIWESSYACFSNNPVLVTDIYGDKPNPYMVKKGDNLTKIAKQHGTTVEKLLELNKNITDKNKIQIGQIINLPQVPSVHTKIVSSNNIYKHFEPTVTKHLFGLIEDHGNQGYDITYNVQKNTFIDEAGNETSSFEYKVLNTRATWNSSSGNLGVISFGLTSLAAGKVLQMAFGSGSKLVPIGYSSTGRTLANSLMEQMVMKHIMANPTLGKVIMEGMKDSRWFGWSKMQYSVTSQSGVKTIVHYVAKIENGVIKAVDDFKFK